MEDSGWEAPAVTNDDEDDEDDEDGVIHEPAEIPVVADIPGLDEMEIGNHEDMEGEDAAEVEIGQAMVQQFRRPQERQN
jgi:hypothetical protein